MVIKRKFQLGEIKIALQQKYDRSFHDLTDKLSTRLKLIINQLSRMYARYKTKNKKLIKFSSTWVHKIMISFSLEQRPETPEYLIQLSDKFVKALTLMFRFNLTEDVYGTLRALQQTLSKSELENIIEHLFVLSMMRDIFQQDPGSHDLGFLKQLHKHYEIDQFQNEEIKQLAHSTNHQIRNHRLYKLIFYNQSQVYLSQFNEALNETPEQQEHYKLHLADHSQIKVPNSKLFMCQSQKKLKTIRGRIHNKALFQGPFLQIFKNQLETEVQGSELNQLQTPENDQNTTQMEPQEIIGQGPQQIKNKLVKYIKLFKKQVEKQAFAPSEIQEILYQIYDLI